MKALVLAAGHGTRLGALTIDRPKPMVDVAGRPMIEYTFEWLRHNRIHDVAINLHHAAECLQSHVGDGSRFGLRVRYSFETHLLGSAGALVPLRSFLQGADPFVVVYGDVMTDIDLAPLVKHHGDCRAMATLALTTDEDPTRCGVVSLTSDGLVADIVEKPRREDVGSPWVNAGVYICASAILDLLPVPCPVPYDFARDLFPRLLRLNNRLAGLPTNARVIDVGSPERLLEAATAVRTGSFGNPGWAGTAAC